MKEYIEFCDSEKREITVLWQEKWYLIPYYCLKDIVVENAFTDTGNDQLQWIKNNTKSCQKNAVEEFHKFFDTAMANMGAYKLY